MLMRAATKILTGMSMSDLSLSKQRHTLTIPRLVGVPDHVLDGKCTMSAARDVEACMHAYECWIEFHLVCVS
jgi:hypothetical protein